ncbi:MAG: ribokinase, partial [Pseudomonadota bacterium]
MPPVLVIGSSNTDMVIRVPTLPAPGETVLGGEFQSFAGGKGANQAVAAARAGASVEFLGAVGDDDLGIAARAVLENEGIGTQYLDSVADTASGVALIFVNDAGENCIGVASGANACVTTDQIAQNSDAISSAGILLMQLETPMDAIAAAARAAAEANVRAILNPAPAAALDDALFATLFCITPNAGEATALTGIDVQCADSAATAATRLIERGVDCAVITLGGDGALVADDSGITHIEAPAVPVTDTTGAGDTFNGVLAAMLNDGED